MKPMQVFLNKLKGFVNPIGLEGTLIIVSSLVALGVSLFDLIGGSQFSQPILVGILSVFLIELVLQRIHFTKDQIETSQHLTLLEQKLNAVLPLTPLGIVLESRKTFKSVPSMMSGASDVAIRGGSLHGFIVGNRGLIRTMAVQGCRFRILIMDPKFYAKIETSEAEQPARELRDTQHVINIIEEIVKDASQENPHIKIQLGYLSYPPQFGLFIIDPEKPDGKIQVELYMYYRTPAEERPHFELTRANNGYWYEAFKQQFEMTWLRAKKHEFQCASPIESINP